MTRTTPDDTAAPAAAPAAAPHPHPHPQPTYKQLYDTLLAQYEHAAAVHRAHEATLGAAQAKVKHLQAECDMLLDALAPLAPTQPALMQFLEHTPRTR